MNHVQLLLVCSSREALPEGPRCAGAEVVQGAAVPEAAELQLPRCLLESTLAGAQLPGTQGGCFLLRQGHDQGTNLFCKSGPVVVRETVESI